MTTKKYTPVKNNKNNKNNKNKKTKKRSKVKGTFFGSEKIYKLFILLITYNELNNQKEINKRNKEIKNHLLKISKSNQGKHILQYYKTNNKNTQPNYFYFLFKKLGRKFYKKTCKKDYKKIYKKNLKYVCDFVYLSIKDKDKYLNSSNPENIKSFNLYDDFSDDMKIILDCYLTFINSYLCLINNYSLPNHIGCLSHKKFLDYNNILDSIKVVLSKKKDINLGYYLNYKSNNTIIKLPTLDIEYEKDKVVAFTEYINNKNKYYNNSFEKDKDTKQILLDSDRTITSKFNTVLSSFNKEIMSVTIRYCYYKKSNNNNKNSNNNNKNKQYYIQGMNFISYSTYIYSNYNLQDTNILYLYQMEFYGDYCAYILDNNKQDNYNLLGNLLLVFLGEKYFTNLYKFSAEDNQNYELELGKQNEILLNIIKYFVTGGLFYELNNHYFYIPLLNYIFKKGLTKKKTFIPYKIIVFYLSICCYLKDNIKENYRIKDLIDIPGEQMKNNLFQNKYSYKIDIKKMDRFINRLNYIELNKHRNLLKLNMDEFIKLGKEKINLMSNRIIL